jgi:mono/diheme cytochrome c family protein
MSRLMTAFILILAAGFTVHGKAQSAAPNGKGSRGYYVKEQATRGKIAYEKNCGKCHLETLKGSCAGEDVSDATRYVCASVGNAPPLIGENFLRRWYTVGDLFSRVRGSMPLDHKDSLSEDENVNIVAYLLQQNGLSAGSDPLKADLNAMKRMVMRSSNAGKSPGATVKEPFNDLGISEGYYTEAQAKRGGAYFQASCGVCHTTQVGGIVGVTTVPNGIGGANYLMPDSARRGWDWGPSQHRLHVLAGDKEFLQLSSMSGPGRPQRYDTVADLFNKVRSTQPPDFIAGLSVQEYLDIVAYIVQQNGFPAGNQELGSDLNQMRNMSLEKGYERLFNGKDLTGWGFVVGTNCSDGPNGCAHTTPGTTFKVQDGMIADSGSPHGYMYPLKKFGPDFTLRLEFRNDPWPGMEADTDYYGNSGYLLFINEHHVWPKTLEIQGRVGMEMWVNPMGGHATYTWDTDLLQKVRRPAGEWSSLQIVSKGNEVWNYLNGTLLSHVSSHDFPPSGYIGIQAESGTLHYRNIRIKTE